MAETDVSESEIMNWRAEMVRGERALVTSVDAAPTPVDPTKEETSGQGLVETLQGQGSGVCLRERL